MAAASDSRPPLRLHFQSPPELPVDPPGPSELPADLPPLPLPPLTTTAPPSSLPTSTATHRATFSSVMTQKTLLASRISSHDVSVDQANPPEPPPYSSPLNDSQSSISQDAHILSETPLASPCYTGLPRLDYKLYSPALFTLSSDCTTLSSSKVDRLTTSASALVSFIRTQASIPPKPLIHVKGNRGRTIDFDFKLNLMSLLVSEDASRRMDYIRCVAPGELAFRGGARPDVLPEVGSRELEEWCRRFIEDPAPVKSFALERVVANMDTLYIEGQIRSLIASTQYKGQIHISFPVTHAKVKVKRAEKSSKLYLGMKNLFSSRHRYEVVQSVWPFASARNGEDGRRWMVQSEEAWWREWRDSMNYVMAQKRQNGAYVTNEDKLEALMEGKGKGVTSIDWGGPDFDEQGL